MAKKTKSATSHRNSGKYPAQFRRTTARTGKWRGRKASEYFKYQKIKRQAEPTHRFDSYRGYVSLNRQGGECYTLIGKAGKGRLVLTKIFKKDKKKYANLH